MGLNIVFLAGITALSLFIVKGKCPTDTKPRQDEYYRHKVSHFTNLRQNKSEIVFAGDSLIDRANWHELMVNCDIINRGVSGDTSARLLSRMDDIVWHQPKMLFIMVGANDLYNGVEIDTLVANYQKIIDVVRKRSPETIIYMHSILPTVYRMVPITKKNIRIANGRLKALADNDKVFYIDLYRHMADGGGDLNGSYTFDGLHLNGKGYLVWKHAIDQYIK